MTRAYKFLVVDDHWIARSAISRLLLLIDRNAEIIEAEDGATAAAAAQEGVRFDAAIVDLNMPGQRVFDVIRVMRSRQPLMRVVVMSVSEMRADVLASLAAGAVGYVPKTSGPEDILSAFRRVLSGEVSFPPRLLAIDTDTQSALAKDVDIARFEEALQEFTPRQKDVLRLMGRGARNAEIADELVISVNTVRAHVQAIMNRLEIHNRDEIKSLTNRSAILRSAA